MKLGFRADVPREWNRWWVTMWPLFSGALIALAFTLPFWPHWVLLTIPLFFVPEIISIWRQNDSLPPLTHFVRHFLPNWVAFPVIYFLVGSIGARALGFGVPRNLHVGILFALLGWMTDHFAVTYAEPDPHPFSRRAEVTPRTTEPRRITL